MQERVTFVFKGERDYVQGTSVFSAVVSALQTAGIAGGELDISFRKMLRSPAAILERRNPTPEDAVVARISCPDGDPFHICVNDAPEAPPPVRQAYDEAEICKGAVLKGKSIVQHACHHDDGIELLVSLCKKMHLECISSDKKWLFARYVGAFPLPPISDAEIRIVKQLGTRLTCSDVLANGNRIGDMYFS